MKEPTIKEKDHLTPTPITCKDCKHWVAVALYWGTCRMKNRRIHGLGNICEDFVKREMKQFTDDSTETLLDKLGIEVNGVTGEKTEE